MASQAHLLQPRPYQLEMLEESLKRNVIVAMDTGSGKTHIAVLRIEAALQRSGQDKRVWFLAPKVALAEQQHNVLKRALPGYGHRLLCGADGVDKWTEQHLWDATLLNVNIVVSTPDVLNDALSHGFVHLSRISLLVFDEAHHCVQNHGMNKIMKWHYFPMKYSKAKVPNILGLTASPVKKMDCQLIEEIEANLDSVIVTPSLHRSELLSYSNRPSTRIHQYASNAYTLPRSAAVLTLQGIYQTYDIEKDPRVIELRAQQDSAGKEQLDKTLYKRKTFSLEQLKSLLSKAVELEKEIGPFAAEWYLRQCHMQLESVTRHGSETLMLEWTKDEKTHISRLLEQVTMECRFLDHGLDEQSLSQKFIALVQILVSNLSEHAACIVFTKQRATVAALTKLLSIHPLAKKVFRIGSFVGTSANVSRTTNISDLADLKTQQTFLDAFRSGEINLMISTNVLEEGIDIPACNLVVCFDPPQNLISFVQRRGRARQDQSQYIIMLPAESTKIKEWQTAEEMLNAIYAEEERKMQDDVLLESQHESSDLEIRVQSTRALINMENALGHLHHFCNTLRGQYIDATPVFSIRKESSEDDAFRSAIVTLPASLDPVLRTAHSSRSWRSERRAKQDAALSAYKQLYEAGLINDHMLPVTDQFAAEQDLREVHLDQALVEVTNLCDPWQTVAIRWRDRPLDAVCYEVRLEAPSETITTCNISIAASIPEARPLQLHYIGGSPITVTVSHKRTISEAELADARNACQAMYHALYRNHNIGIGTDYLAVVTPDFSSTRLSTWASNANACSPLSQSPQKLADKIVFDRSRSDVPHVCSEVLVAPPSLSASNKEYYASLGYGALPVLCAKLRRLPRARNFLRQMSEPEVEADRALRRERFVPVDLCSTDGMEFQTLIPAHVIPSVLRHWRNLMIAEELRNTVLKPVDFHSNDLVLQAICASSAREQVDYQRLEFLGDCILKLLVALHLFANKPHAPEAVLSRFKDGIVSNQSLAKAAIDKGIDRFIIVEPFKGEYVRPLHISEVLLESEDQEPHRILPRKTLADVVESLIGASYLEGSGFATHGASRVNIEAGLLKATRCLSIFFDQLSQPLSITKSTALQTELPPPHVISSYSSKIRSDHLTHLQNLLSYTFTHSPLIISALTHASQSADTALRTYDRLEFLGDALLDFIVTNYLITNHPSFPHPRLHNLRQSTVNADFLAHACMYRTISVERNDVTRPTAANKEAKLGVRTQTEEHALWHFMRWDVMASELTSTLKKTSDVHDAERLKIDLALGHGSRYPWADLMAIGAPKCVSDIVESTIAASWLDVTSSVNDAFAVAEALAERFGIMGVLKRLANEEVECMQPVERAHVLARGEKLDYEIVDSTSSEDGGEAGKKDIMLLAQGVEVVRMPVVKVVKSEVMNEARVSNVQKSRLAERAIEMWDQPGGGGEVIERIKVERKMEKDEARAHQEEGADVSSDGDVVMSQE